MGKINLMAYDINDDLDYLNCSDQITLEKYIKEYKTYIKDLRNYILETKEEIYSLKKISRHTDETAWSLCNLEESLKDAEMKLKSHNKFFNTLKDRLQEFCEHNILIQKNNQMKCKKCEKYFNFIQESLFEYDFQNVS